MRYIIVLLFSLVLMSCGTASSNQDTARAYAEKTANKRKGINALAYGQSMKTAHRHLLDHYHPVTDFLVAGHSYVIDEFYLDRFSMKSHPVYIALFENGTLVAVTASESIKDYPSPYHMNNHFNNLSEKTDEAGCNRFYSDYNSDRYLKSLVRKIKDNKVKLGHGALVLSEEAIQAHVKAQSNETNKTLSGQDAAELAIMSPILVATAPAAVMIAPITVPYAMISNNDYQKRTANRASRLGQVRDIPLGVSVQASERPEQNISFRKSRVAYQKQCATSQYDLIKSEMDYDVMIFARDNRTFMRLYPNHKSFW